MVGSINMEYSAKIDYFEWLCYFKINNCLLDSYYYFIIWESVGLCSVKTYFVVTKYSNSVGYYCRYKDSLSPFDYSDLAARYYSA